MDFEQIMNMCASYTDTIFELVLFGIGAGFIGVTILSFLAYGIFKAFALLSVKK